MEGETLTRCPLRPLLDYPALFQEYFELYSWYKQGHFPDTGSFLDQAAAYVSLIYAFDKAIADAKALKDKVGKGRGVNQQPTVVRNGK